MRFRFVCALASSYLVVGCSFERAGTAEDIALSDSSGLPDSFAPDTLSEDVPEPEEPVDSVAADATEDAADTADTADVTPEVPVTGSVMLTGTSAVSFPVDLSAEGTRSWAHWGLLGPDSFTRKIGSGELANGVNATPAQYDSFPTGFTWSDGDPTLSATATKTGIYRNSTGRTLEFNAQADATERTLRIYVATQSTTGTLTVSLTDASAPPASIALPVAGTPAGAVHRPQVITAVYRAASSCRLMVKIEQTSGGFVSLFAASLR